MRRRALVALLALCASPALRAMSEAERARIDRLIDFIARHKSARFVRNGSSHSGADAAKFLRAKFDKIGEHVGTAAQFIDQIATKSSTTGQPYLVRFADGRSLPLAQVLGEELARMDRP